MKKLIALVGIFLLFTIQSCLCPDREFSTTYVTIESVRGLFYSFSEHGIFPHLEEYHRSELGLSVMADSTSERIEVSQLIRPFFPGAYACADPSRTEFENLIDSVNIFTVYDFDARHPAGANINSILRPMDGDGQTRGGVDISQITFVTQHFKFSAVPTFDSMQFVVTGRIAGKGNFSTQTDLVILPQ